MMLVGHVLDHVPDHVLDHVPDYMLDHVLDHVFDHMIIGLVAAALHYNRHGNKAWWFARFHYNQSKLIICNAEVTRPRIP